MTYKREVLADSPIIYYRLNEAGAATTVLDESPSLVNGTVAGSGHLWRAPGALPGEVNGALRTGSSTRITLTRRGLTANQSRMAWVKTTSPDATTSYGGNPALTVLGDSTASVWDGFGVHDGKAQFNRFNNTSWQTFASSKLVNDGRWHHIGVSYNSSTLAVVVYVDGEVDGSGSMTAHQNQGGVDRILCGYGTADFFLGDVDEVEIYNTVVPPERFKSRWLVGRRGLSVPRAGGRI